MIIVGYQGIGKSTLAAKDDKFISLESSSFYINGKRSKDWYIPYCEIAFDLSKQGFIVFTSSHKVVRGIFRNSFDHMALCYPNESLHDQWINKLQKRYDFTGLDEDYRALQNVKFKFYEDINDLKNEKEFGHIVLTSIDYDLKEEINKYLKNRRTS